MRQTIFAFEHVLKEERGKTTQLARTRQKIKRVGVVETLKDWAVAKQETEGFRTPTERVLPEPTCEAIALRYSRLFPRAAVDALRARLVSAGVTGRDMLSPLEEPYVYIDD